MLLFADLARVPAPLSDTACLVIEAQIPAFADYSVAHGLGAAARTFPEVWWHTLVCPRCDGLYRALCELADLPLVLWPAADKQRRCSSPAPAHGEAPPANLACYNTARVHQGGAPDGTD